MQSDFIWSIAAFIITLLVLSYVLGDNPLFRVVAYIFVGVSTAYAAVLIVYQILFPRLIVPLLSGSLAEKLALLIPAVICLLLVFKLFPRLSSLGNPSMAFLVGVGAAVAITGAVTGTLFGQINGALAPFDISNTSGTNWAGQLLSGVILLIGTISSLAYFQFTAQKRGTKVTRSAPLELLSIIGQAFIAITLGALFAGVLSAALTALIERIDFIRVFLLSLIS
jgi:hypothetical protein